MSFIVSISHVLLVDTVLSRYIHHNEHIVLGLGLNHKYRFATSATESALQSSQSQKANEYEYRYLATFWYFPKAFQ